MALQLINSSIVFIIRDNNPAMYSPDFLAEYAVFPSTFKAQPVVLIPPFTQIRYGEGYLFESLENRVKFEINYQEALGVENQDIPDILSEVGSKFLDAMPNVMFESLGVNFRFIEDSGSLQEFKHNLPANAYLDNLKYHVEHEGLTVNVTLVRIENGSTSEPGILIDINFDGSAGVGKTRPERVSIVRSYVGKREEFLAKAKELAHDTVN